VRNSGRAADAAKCECSGLVRQRLERTTKLRTDRCEKSNSRLDTQRWIATVSLKGTASMVSHGTG